MRKRFSEKILITESDDWGLERGIDEDSIQWATRKYGRENFTRWTLDALETNEDLELLYSLLRSYRDSHGNHPVVTANFITHNVDYNSPGELRFIPISSGFNSETDLRRMYRLGIDEGLIFPQLHGYSHYNIAELGEYFGRDEAKEAFQNKYLACASTIRGRLSFLQGELSGDRNISSLISDAAYEFEKMFGFRSASIIPPTFILAKSHTGDLTSAGIRLVQSSNRLVDPEKNRYAVPYFRKKNGLVWSVRNSRLDPYPGYDFHHEQCVESIGKAFENNLPAVIDVHRVNFSGKFDPDYRNRTLDEFDKLLKDVLAKWPDIRFMNTQNFTEEYWPQEIR